MSNASVPARRDELTHRANLRETRYGWLRLTPAYSVHLVRELLGSAPPGRRRVLDPFCGTGTTALVCAEMGVAADTLDINPFLLWLTATKTRAYPDETLRAFRQGALRVARAIQRPRSKRRGWVPPLHHIDRWWTSEVLDALARAMKAIRSFDAPGAGARSVAAAEPAESVVDPMRGAADLLRIAFCRTLIEQSNASFGHQSMSFKPAPKEAAVGLVRASRADAVLATWERAVRDVALGASSPIRSEPRAIHADARNVAGVLRRRYDVVITSPPYPNRMSYIRELRPYMYWLGYLSDGRAAGELDWQAIGGTWGTATSRVGRWSPPTERSIPHARFVRILERIGTHSELLARYVHKYFFDMVDHVRGVCRVLRPGGQVHYIVGNSKFYDVLLPVEEIFAGLFVEAGLVDAETRVIRKRSSKKELFEYVVTARKPRAGATRRAP